MWFPVPLVWFSADSLGLADADPVGSWVDNMGGDPLVQTTADNKPVFKTNIINGLPVVRFATNDWLDVTFTLERPETVFFVYRKTAGAGGAILDGHTQHGPSFYFSGPTTLRVYGTGSTTGTIVDDGLAHLVSSILPTTTANTVTYFDGASCVTGDCGDSDLQGFSLGRFSGYNDFYYNGDIAEVLAYNTTLSDADRLLTETYLKNKYDIA